MNRAANLLHALAAAVADRQVSAMASGSGLGQSAIAVVLTLGQHDRQTVSDLASVCGLTHSATVRLIDRLERDGLVRRAEERQGRTVPIALTEEGYAEHRRLRASQSDFLTDLLAVLPSEDQQDLERLMAPLLSALTTSKADRDTICRFCDEAVCEQSSCPVECAYRNGIAER